MWFKLGERDRTGPGQPRRLPNRHDLLPRLAVRHELVLVDDRVDRLSGDRVAKRELGRAQLGRCVDGIHDEPEPRVGAGRKGVDAQLIHLSRLCQKRRARVLIEGR